MHRPKVWWQVMGRKTFLTSIPIAIRRSWKVGNYERTGNLDRLPVSFRLP